MTLDKNLARDVVQQRLVNKGEVRRLAKAAARATDAATEAVVKRDQALAAAHGPKSHGLLSYEEIAEAAGISKGRVRQIVAAVRSQA